MRFHFSFAVRAGALASVAALAISALHVQAASGPSSGIDPANIDPSCKACADFYQFADGGWIKNHPIPASQSSVSSFQDLADKNQTVLHGILDDAANANNAPGSNEQKIADYYASCMNTDAIDAAGISPIADDLKLAGAATTASLASTLARLHTDGVDAFFRFGATTDIKNSTSQIAAISQSGLGLADRDYYLSDDARSTGIRTAYQSHVQAMFALLGDSSDAAATNAQSVLAVETALAKTQMSRVAMRDPNATYHKGTLDDLHSMAPGFDWAAYARATGVPSGTAVNVSQPDFIKAMNDQLTSLTPDQLHAYLRWHVAHAFAGSLSKPFRDANFAFYATTMQGVKVQQERWKQCVAATDGTLGEALGQLYVAKTFPPSAKADALAMVQNIKQTLRDDFSTLEWMTPQTRARAVAKLDAFQLKIGYPDKWRDYSGLAVTRTSYAANVIAANRFARTRNIGDIGKPVNRARWGMTPPTVNAYYNPSINEIVFPAGILQPPFFNKDADMAVNYGGIGAVIGHESTHGFDDEGRKFDGSGNLVDWWTPQDSAAFDKRAQCIVKQYDALSPEEGVAENGSLVLGEATADLGGLTVAYKAFEKWQSNHPRLTIDGFTPEQRFFMGWAQVWAGSQTSQQIALRARTDVHAYDKFRVNATLANMPAFAQAFFCKLNEPMVRPADQRCQIW